MGGEPLSMFERKTLEDVADYYRRIGWAFTADTILKALSLASPSPVSKGGEA